MKLLFKEAGLADNSPEMIARLLTERDRLEEKNHELLSALLVAQATIKALHGDFAWRIYQHSPEMIQIRLAIENNQGGTDGTD